MGERTAEQTGGGAAEGDDVPGAAPVAAPHDRRSEPRLRVTIDATVRRLGRSDEAETTSTVDVSHGGARLVAPTPLAIGDVVELGVRMSHGIELSLQGLVVQLSDLDGHHAHVAFDSLSATAAELLTELLREHAADQDDPGSRDDPG